MRKMNSKIVLYHCAKFHTFHQHLWATGCTKFPVTNFPLNNTLPDLKRKAKHRKTRPNRRKRKSRMMETSSPLKLWATWIVGPPRLNSVGVVVCFVGSNTAGVASKKRYHNSFKLLWIRGVWLTWDCIFPLFQYARCSQKCNIATAKDCWTDEVLIVKMISRFISLFYFERLVEK